MYKQVIYRLLDGDSDILDGMNTNQTNINASTYNQFNPVASGGASGTSQIGTMGFSQAVQTELTPLLHDEKAFDIFINCLTNPSANAEKGEEGETAEQEDIIIKRSFRAMTLLINDANSAQQIHKQLKQSQAMNKQQQQHIDEEKIYENFLLSPTRVVSLAKKIFAAYHSIYLNHPILQGSKAQSNQGSDKKKKKNQAAATAAYKTKPHLPHLNKTLAVLLEAYPKQVVLASCTNGIEGIQSSLEPMLHLSRCYPDYSSPIHVLTQMIIIGCTGRKKESNTQVMQQQQQAMLMAAESGDENWSSLHDSNNILIPATHRKKFVRSAVQWNIVKQFINAMTEKSNGDNNQVEVLDSNNRGNSNIDIQNKGLILDEYASEGICDALLSIVEFICFPRQLIHPAVASVINGNKNKDKSKEEESAGEIDLLMPLKSKEVIHQLASCAYFPLVIDIQNNHNTNKSYERRRMNNADISSRALLGLFEIATGKARKNSLPPTAVDQMEVDEGIECKAQEETKELPGINDNNCLKAGITLSMHQTLVSSVKHIVRAMDIYFQSITGNDTTDGDDDDVVDNDNAVTHPGGYTVERPFTSRRLDMITLLVDTISFENHEGSTNNSGETVNRNSAKSFLDALYNLPDPSTMSSLDDSDTVYSPWPGLCNLLFDYPENSMYGVQFLRMLHALCMTNHEKTLKLVVQKCKFLSRAIKDCKREGSNRGVLLRCLNVLRLHSQSIGPHSFLRHYLDSHDGWREYETDLKQLTSEQQLPGGGIAVPTDVNNQETIHYSVLDLDLGSAFALEIGFPPSIKPYEDIKEEFEVVLTATPNSSPGKKTPNSSPGKKSKKKNNKKKKKK